MQVIFQWALWGKEGVNIGGEIITKIRFGDDTVILVELLDEFQLLVDRVKKASRRMVLSINIDKTKYMIVLKVQSIMNHYMCK